MKMYYYLHNLSKLYLELIRSHKYLISFITHSEVEFIELVDYLICILLVILFKSLK